MPVPATILGFWEGNSRRDGTVLWIELAGLDVGARTGGSPMFCLGRVSFPPYLSCMGHALWRRRFWFLLGLGDGWAGRCFDASHLEAPVSWLAPALTLLQNAKVRSPKRLNWTLADGVDEPTVRDVAAERGGTIKDGCIHLEEL